MAVLYRTQLFLVLAISVITQAATVPLNGQYEQATGLSSTQSLTSAPSVTDAPSTDDECPTCFSANLDYGIYNAHVRYTATITRAIVPYITQYPNGTEVTSTSTVGSSNSTATSEEAASSTVAGKAGVDNLYARLGAVQPTVTNGQYFDFEDHTISVGNAYAVATAPIAVTIHASWAESAPCSTHIITPSVLSVMDSQATAAPDSAPKAFEQSVIAAARAKGLMFPSNTTLCAGSEAEGKEDAAEAPTLAARGPRGFRNSHAENLNQFDARGGMAMHPATYLKLHRRRPIFVKGH